MHPTSCGRASLINELKIVELGKDKALPVGSIGEICARGPNIAEGYFNNPKATAESFSADGWFKTGDIGYLNEGGWLFILDRAKEIARKFSFARLALTETDHSRRGEHCYRHCRECALPRRPRQGYVLRVSYARHR